MRGSWPRNRLTERLGIEWPVIQGPLGGFASQRLTAAVSNYGGLGSFGAHGLEPDAIRAVIAEIRGLTARPFAMNLWVSMEDEGARASDAAAFERALAPLAGPLAELGSPLPAFAPYSPRRFEDQARVLIDAQVPVFSFIFGVPPAAILEECRARGIVTVGGATTPDEAVALDEAGVDAIVASGLEGGGHRGSFLRPAEESLYGTMSLVPRIADLVDVPVIAAGGIADARGVVAALALGADGVQMGTAFLAFEESGSSPLHRAALRSPAAAHTGLTDAFTGRLARGIRNRLMEELGRDGVEVLPYPLQRALVRNVGTAAEGAGRPDLVPMWAGQNLPVGTPASVEDFLRALVEAVSAPRV